jgi:hypothetical protein
MDHERSLWLLRVDLEQCRSMSFSGGPTPSDDALTPNGGGSALTRTAVAVP